MWAKKKGVKLFADMEIALHEWSRPPHRVGWHMTWSGFRVDLL